MKSDAKKLIPFKGDSLPGYVIAGRHEKYGSKIVGRITKRNGIINPHVNDLHHNMIDEMRRVTQSVPICQEAKCHAQCIVTNVSDTVSLKKKKTKTCELKRIRPSLSSQLQAISKAAADITVGILSNQPKPFKVPQSRYITLPFSPDIGGILHFTATTIRLTVGRLICRFPCPVTFYDSYMQYIFQHPFSPKEIEMQMFYSDMIQVGSIPVRNTLQFKISKHLKEFGQDYDPSNSQHVLTITFARQEDLIKGFETLQTYRNCLGK